MDDTSFEFTVDNVRYHGVAQRADKPWGHALHADISDRFGRYLYSATCVCHPHYDEFEAYQAKNTEELVKAAIECLQDGAHRWAVQAIAAGMFKAGVRLNDRQAHEPKVAGLPDPWRNDPKGG